MNTTGLGNRGEDQAAEYLQKQGFEIIARNWKTPVCEIDIIVRKQKRLYFVEVKTRASTKYGSGLEYITPKKLQQMRFAAELWVQTNGWKHDYQLAAIGIDAGEITFIDEL